MLRSSKNNNLPDSDGGKRCSPHDIHQNCIRQMPFFQNPFRAEPMVQAQWKSFDHIFHGYRPSHLEEWIYYTSCLHQYCPDNKFLPFRFQQTNERLRSFPDPYSGNKLPWMLEII